MKKLNLVLIILLLTCFRVSYSQTIDPDKIKCYLKFEDNLDNSSSSGATFSQTNGDDITYATGKIGDAGYFNNIAVVSSGINLNTHDGFSLTAWVSLENLSSTLAAGQTWIHQKDVDEESAGRILLEALDNDYIGTFSDGIRCDDASTKITTNTWYFVALVKDATEAITSLYINGNLVTTVTSGTDSNTGEIVLGSRKDESSYPVQGGYMDDFLLTSEVLTKNQINLIYENGVEYALNNTVDVSYKVFDGLLNYPDGDLSSEYNSGPGLAIDNEDVTSEDSKMYVIKNTSSETFTTYVQNLLNDGFTQISSNSIDENIFYSLKKDDQLYYLYYTGSKNQVRIIQDNSSRNLVDELDASEQGTGTTEFYLYSIDYTHGEGQTNHSDYWKIDCGAMLIMKLKDNSLFIVDGGHERQSSNAALDGLLNFMYEITGQEEGSSINIRGWFYSHAHGDHVYFTYPFLEKYHNVLNLESVLFNIPSYQTMTSGYDTGTFLMKNAINTYYPNCKYVKLHTGQEFSLQGVLFDVLFTHEDGVTSTGKTSISDFNDTSTILQFTMDGKKFILLGDANGVGQTNLLKMYLESTLKSDCVQTAHHGYNNLTDLYSEIQAPLALWCNSLENGKNSNLVKYQGVVDATDNVVTLFADPDTYKITVEDGEFKTETIPSYRSYFTTINEIPDLTVDASTSGTMADLENVSGLTSLEDEIIDKSVRGTETSNTSEVCSLVLENDTTTKFCTDNLPATITWTMKDKVTVKYYEIVTGNDNEKFVGRNPDEWELFGSNDTLIWTAIDGVTGAGLPDKNYTPTAFSISNPEAYQYYALKITSTASSNILQFSEIKLYTADNTPTSISNEASNEDKINVRKIGDKQVEVSYGGYTSDQAFVSLYNISGQKVTYQKMLEGNAVLSVPGTGVYLVVLNNGDKKIVKKILLN